MKALEILSVLKEICADFSVDSDKDNIAPQMTLLELGFGSMERADILIETLEEIGVSVPAIKLTEVSGNTLTEISEVFYRWSTESVSV